MIGYLGPKGTFSEIALFNFLGDYNISEPTVYYSSIKGLFEALHNSECSSIFVPIENSLGGEVVTSLDCLVQLNADYFITKEFEMKIVQNLLAKPGVQISDITDIFSHEQSFFQCERFVSEYLSNCSYHFCSSNAAAAEIVSNQEFEFNDSLSHTMACIGSMSATKVYGLNCLRENINDNHMNTTRFVMISKQLQERVDQSKSSIIFSTKNEPGSLFSVLSLLSNANINMTRITSRPTKNAMGQYLFFVDFEGHVEDENIKKVCDKIEQSTLWFKFLGSYGKALC